MRRTLLLPVALVAALLLVALGGGRAAHASCLHTPSAIVAPSLTGPNDTQSLTADPGEWATCGDPTFEYLWYENGSLVADDFSDSVDAYAVSDTDIGQDFQVDVIVDSGPGGVNDAWTPALTATQYVRL